MGESAQQASTQVAKQPGHGLWDIHQVVEFLGVSRSHVDRETKRGLIHVYKLAKKNYYNPEEIRKYLKLKWKLVDKDEVRTRSR